MTEVTDKVERAIARFDRVTQQLDQRGGPAQAAARRERQRLNAGLGRTVLTVAVAVALIWRGGDRRSGWSSRSGSSASSSRCLRAGSSLRLLIARGGAQAISAPAPSADLPNGAMVERFNSYIYQVRRALPAPAQAQLDGISSMLPSLKQMLERVDTLDPARAGREAPDVDPFARADRSLRNVPNAYRRSRTAKARRSTSGWSRAWRPAARPSTRSSEQLARQRHGGVRNPGPVHQVALRRAGHRERRRLKHLAIARCARAAHDKTG